MQNLGTVMQLLHSKVLYNLCIMFDGRLVVFISLCFCFVFIYVLDT